MTPEGRSDGHVQAAVAGGRHVRRRVALAEGTGGLLSDRWVDGSACRDLPVADQLAFLQHEERRRARSEQVHDLDQAGLGHLLGGRLRDDGGAEAVERRSLLFPRPGPRLAFAHAPRQCSDDDADHEERDEREPVLRVVDLERVVWRQEEEVPGEEREDRGEDGRPRAGGARHEQDHEQVEERPLALGEDVPAEQEQGGAEGDPRDREDVAVTREHLGDA